MDKQKLSPKQLAAALLDKYPDWEKYLGNSNRGDLEVTIPAPEGSNAGHLVVFTNDADVWIRFAPPRTCYSVESDD